MKVIPDLIKDISRRLRKNMTKSEEFLWEELKGRKLLGKKFLRQSPIYVYTEYSGLDRYIIADFVCLEYKLIIELDGSIHDVEEIYILDKIKENLLENIGFKIIRFKNEEVFENVNLVLEKIGKDIT